MSESIWRRMLRLVGPWPMRPLLVFGVIAFLSMVLATGQTLGTRGAWASWEFYRLILLGIVTGLIAGMISFVFFRMQKRRALGLAPYLGVMFLISLTAVTFRFMTGQIPAFYQQEPGFYVLAVTRFFLFLIVAYALVGSVTARLEREVAQTKEALALAEDQQRQIIEADEETRRQVAALLHDRVQAGLIAACLELQMVTANSPPDVRSSIEGVIQRLETLRALDVRSAARALGPGLGDLDLQTAIEELARQYEPSMGTTVWVDPDLGRLDGPEDHELALGCYRVVEQALLNSATHGRAQHVNVTVRASNDGLELTVEDDGRGMRPGPREPGIGSVLITTWVRLLRGEWDLGQSVTGGAQLTAMLRGPRKDALAR